MRTITTSTGAVIKIYGDAKEMPISRWNEFQKKAVSKSGIGSSVADIDARYAKVVTFIVNDKKNDALKELENTRFALMSAIHDINYDSYCFACFVYSINNIIYNDMSDDGLSLVIEKLKEVEITQIEIETSVEDVKKKVSDEVETLFPDIFNLTDSLIYFGKIKSYLLQMAAELQKEEPEVDKIREQLMWFQLQNKPMSFRSNDTDNILTEIDRRFSEMCSMMEGNGSSNPHNYTCVQFYSKLAYLHKSVKASAA